MTATVESDEQDWFATIMSPEAAQVRLDPADDSAPQGPPPPAETNPETDELADESVALTSATASPPAAPVTDAQLVGQLAAPVAGPSAPPPDPIHAAAPNTPAPGEGASFAKQHLNDDPSARRVVIGLGVGLVVALSAIVATVIAFSSHSAAPSTRQDAVAPVVVPVTPAPIPTTALPAVEQDQAIPYSASSACPPGSTAAQSLADSSSDGAWVCVRGPQGGQVDGQVLHVDLGHSYLISAVSVTPGWIPKTAGGRDEWLQHRVVTRLQYVFNDADHTVFVQQTGNVHGPVMTPLPHKVLASRVTVVVLQTSRPPASPLPASSGTGLDATQPGFGDSVLGPGQSPLPADGSYTSDPAVIDGMTDPVDATFAVSELKFFGHQPN